LLSQGGAIVTGFVLAVTLGLFVYPATTLAFEIEIDVAPNVLNIQSESVVVTVHTDIAESAVVGSTVFLNGVEISHWKSDARGNFVAKFLSDEIKTLDGLIIGDFTGTSMAGSMNKKGDVGILTPEEEAGLLFMREEEKLARDVPLVLFDKSGLRVFENIAQSEQRHMDAVLYLFSWDNK